MTRVLFRFSFRIAALAACAALAQASVGQTPPATNSQPEVQGRDMLVHGGGRPRDMYTLRYARDASACAGFLAAMNEPRDYVLDGRGYGQYSRAANDVFLASRVSVKWEIFDNGNLHYARIDIDNDGDPDHVFKETGTLSGNEFDLIWATPVAPGDPSNYLDVYAEHVRKPPTEPFRIGLDRQSIDFGGGEVSSGGQDFGLGNFKTVAIVSGRAYIVAGGSWQKLGGRDWFPVRLIEMLTHTRQRLICELIPRFRQKWPEENR